MLPLAARTVRSNTAFCYTYIAASSLVPNYFFPPRAPWRSSFSANIWLASLFVDMPTTYSSQPQGRPSFNLICTRSAACNALQNTGAVSSRLPTRGPMMRSTAATLAAATSSERPQKRAPVGPSSTTKSMLVMRVCANRPITTVLSSASPAVAGAFAAF